MSEHRWSKFWWADWMRDPALRSCSVAARGLWMDMLAIAFDGTPRGHVTIGGRPATVKQLATIAGITERQCTALLAELEGAAVFSRAENRVIVSRRMTRDQEKSNAGRDAISKRWEGKEPNRGSVDKSVDNFSAASENACSFLDNQKSDVVSVAENAEKDATQGTVNAQNHPSKPNRVPNSPPISPPHSLEADTEVRREKESKIDIFSLVQVTACPERAEPAEWPPPPTPSAVEAAVGQLTAKLEGRYGKRPTPQPRPIAVQLAAVAPPPAIKPNLAPPAVLAEARARLMNGGKP